jgi:hypothetical protein
MEERQKERRMKEKIKERKEKGKEEQKKRRNVKTKSSLCVPQKHMGEKKYSVRNYNLGT